jgi:hypothetical protein
VEEYYNIKLPDSTFPFSPVQAVLLRARNKMYLVCVIDRFECVMEVSSWVEEEVKTTMVPLFLSHYSFFTSCVLLVC